ncbi:MAG: response regulator [Proteobacteria bacterium]|nr:response regulator [Pseudomonadota bacterium]
MSVYVTSIVYLPENVVNIPVYPLDVFARTDLGNDEIQRGTTNLSAEALVVLVLIDGHATVGDIEQKAAHVPPEQLRNQLRVLLGNGLVRPATIAETEGLDFGAFFNDARSGAEPSAGTKASAELEASTGGPQLKREGYYVSIARRAVKARQPENGMGLLVLVVEDDQSMAQLVTLLLDAAGFAVETAACRDEILARLRQQPVPDAILLDVTLVDANGFDVLQALKKHSLLKTVPVVMLTADAKQESIVRGLVGGADGYITKPFEPKVLIDGIKAILGLS